MIACSMGRKGAVSDAEVPSVPKKPAASSRGNRHHRETLVRAINPANIASVSVVPSDSRTGNRVGADEYLLGQ